MADTSKVIGIADGELSFRGTPIEYFKVDGASAVLVLRVDVMNLAAANSDGFLTSMPDWVYLLMRIDVAVSLFMDHLDRPVEVYKLQGVGFRVEPLPLGN